MHSRLLDLKILHVKIDFLVTGAFKFSEYIIIRYLNKRLRIHWLYPLQRGRIPPRKIKRHSLYETNCIWWWGSSWGDLGYIKYFFIAITPRYTLTRSCMINSQIVLFNKYLLGELNSLKIIRINNLKKIEKKGNSYTKIVDIDMQWTGFLNLKAQNNHRRVEIPNFPAEG